MIAGKLCHHPEDVRQLFPHDPIALQLEIESYLGVPLLDPQGNTLGHLAVLDDRPMPGEANDSTFFGFLPHEQPESSAPASRKTATGERATIS